MHGDRDLLAKPRSTQCRRDGVAGLRKEGTEIWSGSWQGEKYGSHWDSFWIPGGWKARKFSADYQEIEKRFKSLFHLLKNCACRAGSFTAQQNYLKPSLPSSPVPSRRVSKLSSLFSGLSLFAFPFASISSLSTSDPWPFLLLQSRG